jgi:predicted nucleic acid binding AN1-type Zn finger protein
MSIRLSEPKASESVCGRTSTLTKSPKYAKKQMPALMAYHVNWEERKTRKEIRKYANHQNSTKIPKAQDRDHWD